MHVIDAKHHKIKLLGRPWVHENIIVLSSYYQCLKYLKGGIKRKIVADDNHYWTTSHAPPPDDVATATHCCKNYWTLSLNCHKSSYFSHVASS